MAKRRLPVITSPNVASDFLSEELSASEMFPKENPDKIRKLEQRMTSELKQQSSSTQHSTAANPSSNDAQGKNFSQ